MPPKPAAAVQEHYNYGDLVLGRIKGYPWWPGKVIDPENEAHLRPNVVEGKPNKKTAFLVRYYDDGDYSWLEPKDMKPLSMTDIETFVGKGQKPSALKRAYQTAQSPEDWEKKHYVKMAARAARGDTDEEDDEPPKKKQKKSTGAASTSKAKTSASKKDTDSKAKKEDKKSASDANEPEVVKLCRAWRSKLQRAFLGKEAPKPEDCPSLDEVFTAMEAWTPDQAGLEPSKLPKVLKRIPLVEYTIPDESRYRFKERSSALLANWQSALGGSVSASTPVAPAAPAAAAEAGAEVSPAPPVVPSVEETNGGDTTMLTDVDTSMVANGTESEVKPAEEPAVADAAPVEVPPPAEPVAATEPAPVL